MYKGLKSKYLIYQTRFTLAIASTGINSKVRFLFVPLFPIITKLYEFLVYLEYKSFIPKKALVFDVGANVGMTSDIFCKLGANVIAFEPNKQIYDILCSKSKNKNIICCPYGLWSADGYVPLHIADDSLVSTMSGYWKEAIFSEENYSHTDLVPVYRHLHV